MSDLLSVVIPTFNEGGNIENLVSQIDEALEGINYEIIFVDDSKDNTPDIIKEVSKKYPSVRLYHRENKSGLATAVLDGFRIARGDYIACMDADLQHPPIVLKYMYKAIVVGGKMGQVILPCLRKFTDPTSGLFMFRRGVIDNVELKPIGWKIMIEVLAMGNYSKVIEIPYQFHQRTEGESKLSGKVTLEYIKQLFELKERYNKNNHFKIKRWSYDKMIS